MRAARGPDPPTGQRIGRRADWVSATAACTGANPIAAPAMATAGTTRCFLEIRNDAFPPLRPLPAGTGILCRADSATVEN